MCLTCPAAGVPLHFILRPIRMIHPPLLRVFDPFWPTPIIRIFGQPAPLSGGFPPLLAKLLGTVMLAWVTARIRLEPLFAAETFFAAMLELHPAFLITATWHSPWILATDDTRLSHDLDNAFHPKTFPCGFSYCPGSRRNQFLQRFHFLTELRLLRSRQSDLQAVAK